MLELNRRIFGLALGLPYAVTFLIIYVANYSYGAGTNLARLEEILLLSSTSPVSIFAMSFLIPLYLMYRWFGRQQLEAFKGGEAKKRSILLPAAVCALSVLTLLHTGVIFLVVLMILAERYATSSFGFHADRFVRNLLLGVLLYLSGSLTPLVFGYVSPVFNYAFTAVSVGAFDWTLFLRAFPYATIIIGLAEEGLFRGYLQTKFSALVGSWKAVLLQALLFGLAHLSPDMRSLEVAVIRVSWTFLFGFVAGSFFRYTRNLTGPVLLHGLVDSVYLGFRPSTVSFMPIPISTIVAQFAAGHWIQALTMLGREPAVAVSIFTIGVVLFLCIFAGRICRALGISSEMPLGSFR